MRSWGLPFLHYRSPSTTKPSLENTSDRFEVENRLDFNVFPTETPSTEVTKPKEIPIGAIPYFFNTFSTTNLPTTSAEISTTSTSTETRDYAQPMRSNEGKDEPEEESEYSKQSTELPSTTKSTTTASTTPSTITTTTSTTSEESTTVKTRPSPTPTTSNPSTDESEDVTKTTKPSTTTIITSTTASTTTEAIDTTSTNKAPKSSENNGTDQSFHGPRGINNDTNSNDGSVHTPNNSEFDNMAANATATELYGSENATINATNVDNSKSNITEQPFENESGSPDDIARSGPKGPRDMPDLEDKDAEVYEPVLNNTNPLISNSTRVETIVPSAAASPLTLSFSVMILQVLIAHFIN